MRANKPACGTRTFADGLAVVPRAVLGTTDGGGRDGFHEVARVALIAHGLVEGEVRPKLDAVGQCAWIATADN